ncbi:hypothetical protein BP6252_14107 [Coleophoma cylindrospora]|uniref:Uncharacterized protein n=1 Tax=Coleophoma cylindrospora TaxID=1849047 RepID=A0A3D8Q4C6_9HELO|nr:hypothetical protein BP6252_14107 [Coleophoma cylindrospora]
MPMSGIRCRTCALSRREVWVIPGRNCGYCGTPDGDGPSLKGWTASSPKDIHCTDLTLLSPIYDVGLPFNYSGDNMLHINSELMEIVRSDIPGDGHIVNRRKISGLFSRDDQIPGSSQSHVLQLITCVTPTSQLPFPNGQVKEVLKTWLLPNEWLEHSVNNELLQFAWCDIRAINDGSPHLQFLVRDQKDSILTDLAISANLASNTVRGYWILHDPFQGPRNDQLRPESLEANASLEAAVVRIGLAKDLTRHPLLLPIFLLEQRVQTIERLLNDGFSGVTYAAYSLILNTINRSMSNGKNDRVQSDMRTITQGMFDAHKRNSTLKRDISNLKLLASAIERGFGLLENAGKPLIDPKLSHWTVVKSRYEFLGARISALDAAMTRAGDEVQIIDNMIYNLINQQDNRLNCSIAEDSKKIAAATGADSSAMTTMAFVTTLFLPGTFIAAVLDFLGHNRAVDRHSYWDLRI